MEDEKDVPKSTIEELIEINLDPENYEEKKKGRKGAGRSPNNESRKGEMRECLRRNKDIFAWSHKDIPGVDPEEAEHCLNIDPSHPPVRQEQRRFVP